MVWCQQTTRNAGGTGRAELAQLDNMMRWRRYDKPAQRAGGDLPHLGLPSSRGRAIIHRRGFPCLLLRYKGTAPCERMCKSWGRLEGAHATADILGTR